MNSMTEINLWLLLYIDVSLEGISDSLVPLMQARKGLISNESAMECFKYNIKL